MKMLEKLLNHIPEQVLSTSIGVGILFIGYRGIVSIVNDLPDPQYVLIVLMCGIVLGVLSALTSNKMNLPTDD